MSSPVEDPTLESPPPSIRSIWAPRWWAVFLIGVAMWVATIGAAYLTANLILLPTIVLIGSFLIPVTAVVWNLDHDPSPELSPRRILSAFIVAGVVGVLGASVLEYYFVGGGLTGFLKVGLIEEFVKGLLILAVAWGIHTYRTKDGMVLGATVGFGFAALESSGYALVSLFVIHGHQLFLSVTSVITTELIRGVLAPFGHGMWSAILGGVIFSAARRGQLRMAWSVLGAFVLVAILHGAFDTFSGIIGYLVVSAVGLIPLVWLWRRADAIDRRRRIS